MDRQRCNMLLGAVLTTLNEVDYAPRSMIYMACQMSVDDTSTITNLLSAAELVKFTPDTVRLTPKGKELAQKIQADIDEKLSKKP